MAEKLGALWVRDYTDKQGNARKLMSGNVVIGGEQTDIVVYKNDYKEEAKHPDYVIYLSKPRESKRETRDEADVPF